MSRCSRINLAIVSASFTILTACGLGSGDTSPSASASGSQPTSGSSSETGAPQDKNSSPKDTSPSASSGNSGQTATNEVTIGVRFDRFGETAPGTTINETMFLLQNSERQIHVTEISVSGSAFRLIETENECVGASFPGPACSFTVAKTPPGEGEYTGTLEVWDGTTLVAESTLRVRGSSMSSEPPAPAESSAPSKSSAEVSEVEPPTTS